MMVVIFIAGVLIGVAVAARPYDECPRKLLGYNHLGKDCDHRQSEIYKAKMARALNDEMYK